MSEHLDQQLSAYLDDVLIAEEMRALEQRIATEPAVAARFDGLKRANSMARDYFASVLHEPVPLALARAIEGSGSDRQRVPVISSSPDTEKVSKLAFLPILRAIAASLTLVLGGAAGGYIAATWPSATKAPAGWLADIADYHRIYASEQKHLVEVAASEKDHIETWLTKVVGVPVIVPDLQAQGLTFAGGRLLVAASKPVAQLMYRHADGTVVALCMMKSAAAAVSGEFVESLIGGTKLVSWTDQDSAYVIVGELGDAALVDIARAAAPLV